MYLLEAIAAADALRPNTVEDKLKAEWLEDIETKFAEVQQIKVPAESFPEDKELLMPKPVDQVYVYWLAAKIDWAQLDLDLYAVDNTMYAQAFNDACAWWRRHNRPLVNAYGARLEP